MSKQFCARTPPGGIIQNRENGKIYFSINPAVVQMQNTNKQLSTEEAGWGFTFLFSWKSRAHKQVLCPTKWNYLEVWWRLVKIKLWKKYKYTEQNLHLIFVAIKKATVLSKTTNFIIFPQNPKQKHWKKSTRHFQQQTVTRAQNKTKPLPLTLNQKNTPNRSQFFVASFDSAKFPICPVPVRTFLFLFIKYFVEFSLALCVKTR